MFVGDYPISTEIKVLPLEGGKGTDTDSEQYYEDTKVLLFAFGVDSGGTAAIIQTDEKVAQGSDVANMLAGILQFGVSNAGPVKLPLGRREPPIRSKRSAPTSPRTRGARRRKLASVCPSIATRPTGRSPVTPWVRSASPRSTRRMQKRRVSQ